MPINLLRYSISDVSFPARSFQLAKLAGEPSSSYVHLSAARCANALLNWLNLRQLLSFGKSVSSAGLRVMIVAGGNDAVLAFKGYIPQKVCCILTHEAWVLL